MILGLMALYSYLSNRVVKDKHQTIFAIAMAIAVVLWGVKILDLSWTDIGIANPLMGFFIGGMASVVIAAVIWIASANKLTRNFFIDSRAQNILLRQMLKKTLFDIPVATVLFEELLFRGLLLGFLLSQTDQLTAVVVSSLLFGIWHILPSIKFAKTNDKAARFPFITIVATVAVTSVAGLFFAWLRVESGSILAPIMVHFTANSGSFFASWLNSRKLDRKNG